MQGDSVVPPDPGFSGKGSFGLWLKHPRAGWATDDARADFKSENIQGIAFMATKHPDRIIEFIVFDAQGRKHSFREPVPPTSARGLRVGFLWERMTLGLFLNDQRVATQDVASKV